MSDDDDNDDNDDQEKRDQFVTWEEHEAARERHDSEGRLRPRGLADPIMMMDAEEFDRLIANNRLVFAGPRMEGQ